jgi:hypothetical protein
MLRSLVAGGHLDTVGAVSSRRLVTRERLSEVLRRGQGAAQDHAVLNGHAGALTQVRGHGMRRIAQHGDPAACPHRQRLPVSQTPLEQIRLTDRGDELSHGFREIVARQLRQEAEEQARRHGRELGTAVAMTPPKAA